MVEAIEEGVFSAESESSRQGGAMTLTAKGAFGLVMVLRIAGKGAGRAAKANFRILTFL